MKPVRMVSYSLQEIDSPWIIQARMVVMKVVVIMIDTDTASGISVIDIIVVVNEP